MCGGEGGARKEDGECKGECECEDDGGVDGVVVVEDVDECGEWEMDVDAEKRELAGVMKGLCEGC